MQFLKSKSIAKIKKNSDCGGWPRIIKNYISTFLINCPLLKKAKQKSLTLLRIKLASNVVGMIGFEPMVFCSQSRRDSQATLHPEAPIYFEYNRSINQAKN